ncbi:protein kinase domain-containing protein [Nakamurella sp.]|uniref:protein kinase domain-containing protein n=1 Tax=Nakamurella sp. TaxID=1869182 RepID=UPI00378499C2
MVGYRYANRYQAADVIGQDEISVVRRGRDLLMDRDVAIKVLRSDLTQEPAVHSRFRSFAHHAAALNHPAFVAVYDTGDTLTDAGSVPWVVMEYVEGDSLRTLLDRQGPLPWRRALRIAAELCAALDHAHRRNLLPCHITPANVLVDPQAGGDQVKVIDIGQRTPETPGAKAMQYLSPEQIRGGLPDKRSDQYTIGCVLFEMLCGRAPFIGVTPDSIAEAHQREAPRAPSEYNRSIPPDVDAIVLKALSKNPANRYETAEKMRADLERAGAGRPAQARQQLQAPERTGAPAPSPARSRAAAKPRTTVPPAKPVPGLSSPLMAPGLTLPVLDEVELIDPAREAAQRRRWAYIGLGGLALALVVALWLTLVVITTPPPPAKVSVPNVTGLTIAQASAVLKDKELDLGAVTTVDTDKGPTGTIVYQRPSERTEVEAGTAVAVEIEG